MARKKHRDDGTEKSQEELDAEQREEELQMRLQSDNLARQAEDGFVAPSPDAPKMDEQTFARNAGLPHDGPDDPVQKAAREAEEKKRQDKEGQQLDWKEDQRQNCPTCGFKYSGCHDKHVTVVLARKVILNGIEMGPGEVTVPEEAQATWALGL